MENAPAPVRAKRNSFSWEHKLCNLRVCLYIFFSFASFKIRLQEQFSTIQKQSSALSAALQTSTSELPNPLCIDGILSVCVRLACSKYSLKNYDKSLLDYAHIRVIAFRLAFMANYKSQQSKPNQIAQLASAKYANEAD